MTVTDLGREEWRRIPGWPHEVSNLGRIRNMRTGNILKPVPHKSGYLNTQLWDNGRFSTQMVHRLVAIAFYGPPPTVAHEVGHRNGDRHNNAAENLRWVLHEENMRDRDAHGTTARGSRNGKLKFSDELVAEARRLRDAGYTLARIAEMTGISAGTLGGYERGRMRREAWARGVV